MPALFLGHGSPMNAIEDSRWRRAWADLARRLPRPRAIVCVSAHWETQGIAVTAAARPETIHDFYGFPPALHAVRYPAPGDPALAGRIEALAAPDPMRLDRARGLDHGAWGVLLPMYPEADLPVVQLSLDARRTPAQHYALAGRLAPLREEGILVVGSGNIVHNLALMRRHPEPADWARRFDAAVRAHIAAGEHAALVDYAAIGPEALRAVPTPEHYLPLLYVLALLRQPDDAASFLNDEVLGTLSMTSVVLQ
jgi:4,5-DOPA dioxygenase extradiol